MKKQELIEMLRRRQKACNPDDGFSISNSEATDLIRELEGERKGAHTKVKAVTDGDGHWYIIPNDIVDDFDNDLADEEICDSGQFDNKYGQYRTGGD